VVSGLALYARGREFETHCSQIFSHLVSQSARTEALHNAGCERYLKFYLYLRWGYSPGYLILSATMLPVYLHWRRRLHLRKLTDKDGIARRRMRKGRQRGSVR